MLQLLDGSAAGTIKIRERTFRERKVENVFGTLVRALAPVKPQVWLADKLGCTERGALMLINGERKVTARCIAVIVNEMLA